MVAAWGEDISGFKDGQPMFIPLYSWRISSAALHAGALCGIEIILFTSATKTTHGFDRGFFVAIAFRNLNGGAKHKGQSNQ